MRVGHIALAGIVVASTALLGESAARADRLVDLAKRPIPRQAVTITTYKPGTRPMITVKWGQRSLAYKAKEHYDDQVRMYVDGKYVTPAALWRRLPDSRLRSIAAQLVRRGVESTDPRLRGTIAVLLSEGMGYGLDEMNEAGLKLSAPIEFETPAEWRRYLNRPLAAEESAEFMRLKRPHLEAFEARKTDGNFYQDFLEWE